MFYMVKQDITSSPFSFCNLYVSFFNVGCRSDLRLNKNKIERVKESVRANLVYQKGIFKIATLTIPFGMLVVSDTHNRGE